MNTCLLCEKKFNNINDEILCEVCKHEQLINIMAEIK